MEEKEKDKTMEEKSKKVLISMKPSELELLDKTRKNVKRSKMIRYLLKFFLENGGWDKG